MFRQIRSSSQAYKKATKVVLELHCDAFVVHTVASYWWLQEVGIRDVCINSQDIGGKWTSLGRYTILVDSKVIEVLQCLIIGDDAIGTVCLQLIFVGGGYMKDWDFLGERKILQKVRTTLCVSGLCIH